MRYCPNCGSQITEGTRFCANCGTEQNRQQSVQRNTGTKKRLHCPNCRGTALLPVTESSGSIGSVGRLSRNTAIVGSDSINKSYWMCQECGHKFRNLEDLEREQKRVNKAMKILIPIICIMIFLYGAFWCLLGGGIRGWISLIFLIIVGYLLLRFVIMRIFNEQYDKEKERLRKACFD